MSPRRCDDCRRPRRRRARLGLRECRGSAGAKPVPLSALPEGARVLSVRGAEAEVEAGGVTFRLEVER